jgi:ABC-2 type transport system ATP-binding protein
MDTLIVVEQLRKTFVQGFWRKKVEAVKGVSFEVHRGEIFGFVGPNGAGKTSTIKMLTGLIAPSSGKASLFGHQIPSHKAMKMIGFLPENPYIYPYLTPREFVELCGSLSGLRGGPLHDRTNIVLGQVGIAYAADRQVRRLSKGMVQRTGLAAALVADPELLILDEPMSGLDPVGRKEVRDLIREERAKGRTIFFSTHILADVETLCDRVTVLRSGEVVVSGKLRDLLRGDVLHTEIVVVDVPQSLVESLQAAGQTPKQVVDHWVIEVQGDQVVNDVLRMVLESSANVVEVSPRRETLEDLFMRRAIGVQEEQKSQSLPFVQDWRTTFQECSKGFRCKKLSIGDKSWPRLACRQAPGRRGVCYVVLSGVFLIEQQTSAHWAVVACSHASTKHGTRNL